MTSSSPGAGLPEETEARRPLILVVDDDERNRRLARDILRAAGLGVLEAATGEDGIALAIEHRPDVVVMDLRLPDLSGAEVVQRLRADSRTTGIPVVASSALSIEGYEQSLQAAGFTGFVQKPIDVTSFAEQIRRYRAG